MKDCGMKADICLEQLLPIESVNMEKTSKLPHHSALLAQEKRRQDLAANDNNICFSDAACPCADNGGIVQLSV